MRPSSAARKQRYGKALYRYGIIPLLLLLEEYEKKEDYMECGLIRDAIQDRVDYINKVSHMGEDFNLPRHISEVDGHEKDYWSTQEENFKRNVKNYVQAIKELVDDQVYSQ